MMAKMMGSWLTYDYDGAWVASACARLAPSHVPAAVVMSVLSLGIHAWPWEGTHAGEENAHHLVPSEARMAVIPVWSSGSPMCPPANTPA